MKVAGEGLPPGRVLFGVLTMTTTIRGNVLTITDAADAAILGMRDQVAAVQAQAARVRAARVQAQADVDAAVRELQDELSEFASFLADAASLIVRTNAHQYAGQTDPTIEPAAAPREAVEEGVVAVPPAKPARKRGKSKTDTVDAAYIAARTTRALVVAKETATGHPSGFTAIARIISDDGSFHDVPGTVDALSYALAGYGLTVYADYPSWDARPVA